MSENSETPSGVNPYASSPMQSSALDDDAYTNLRPGGVTVTGVLCILGGIMGTLASLLGILQLVVGSQFANAMTPGGAAGGAQQKMMAEMQAVNDKFLIFNGIITVGALVFGCLLLIGGIAIFQKKPWVLTWLRRTFFGLAIFEVFRQILYVFVQLEMMPIMQKFFGQMGQGAPGQQAMMSSMQNVMMMIGLAFAIGWALVKIGLFAWGYRYLGKPHVVAYFKASDSAATE